MSLSTLFLSAISIYYFKDNLNIKNFNYKDILIGLFSAFILYGIFWIGKFVLDITGFIPKHTENIKSVYANKEFMPDWLVAALLFFPIGFGEEIFWRGYVQKKFNEKFSDLTAFLLTVVLYTVVHITSLNPILIIAAFIVGLYWGLIFFWRKNIVAALISHMIWDPIIFVIYPLV